MKNTFLLISVFSLLAMGCGNQHEATSEEATAEASVSTPANSLSEDQVLLQLSPYLIANPQDQGELDQNAIIDYAIDQLIPLEKTRAGVFYRVLKTGEGDQLAWGDYIKVHYKGYFLDGQLFDDTRVREKPLEFYIGNMIPGWNEGLQFIAPGGTIQLLVPSPLAYGAKGLPNAKGGFLVPVNTPLVFEVEVLERLKRAGE